MLLFHHQTKKSPSPDSHPHLLLRDSNPNPPSPSRHDPRFASPTTIDHDGTASMSPTARIMLAATSWLRSRHGRRRRCVLLILCSPLLLPFICAACPLLCAAELCLRLCGRSVKKKKKKGAADGAGGAEQEEEDERIRRCEEGRGGCCPGGVGEDRQLGLLLLQRYLEDQLRLVGSVYECGDDDHYDDDGDDGDDRHHHHHGGDRRDDAAENSGRGGDGGFVESCRIPLLGRLADAKVESS